jgi:hypothetical protein
MALRKGLQPALIEVEEVAEETAAPIVVIIIVIPAARAAIGLHLLRGTSGSLDDFVQLTAVQPDAAALRTIVNFDSLTICNLQFSVISRALHASIYTIPGPGINPSKIAKSIRGSVT